MEKVGNSYFLLAASCNRNAAETRSRSGGNEACLGQRVTDYAIESRLLGTGRDNSERFIMET